MTGPIYTYVYARLSDSHSLLLRVHFQFFFSFFHSAVNLFVSFSSAASVAVIVVLILYQKNFYLLYLGTVFLG